MKKERVRKGRGRELEEFIELGCRRRREKIKMIYDVKDFLHFPGALRLTPLGAERQWECNRFNFIM